MALQFPLQFKRQYSGPLDVDQVFATIADKNAYLNNPLRYAGMIVTCKEQEGKIFVLNNDKNEWLTFDSSLYEKTANKVTSFNTPTDTEYPSAKLVKEYVDSKVSAVYKPQGSVLFSSLVVGLLVAANSGFVYNITDAFTTNENFVEGAGKSHSAGTNVVIIEHSGNYKFDVLGGTVDLTPYELLSNKVIAWSETTNDTRYPSEKLVKDSLDELENTIQGVSDLSPYHYEGTFIGGDALQNDFDNLIVAFEDLRGYEYAFKETKLQGSYFVCSADSAFYFNPYYHWSPAEGTSKTSAITYTWSAPYDLNGIEEINMKPGDIISILDFSYDANSNTISTLIKVEKNLEEAFVVKNETIVGKTKPKITYDEKGLVIAGEDLTPDDIPTLPVAKIEGLSTTIPTVTNDLTDDLKENYDDAYTHSQTNHAPSNAEQNVQSDWNQTVDTEDDFIKNKPSIPTKTSDLTNDSGFATETYVNNKVSAVYKPQGSVLFSSLVVGLLVAANSGFVYNITDAFTTNENFVEGAGKSHSAGTNVVIIEHSGNYKFDVLGGTVDLTPYELLSNKVIAWSETTNDTRYPSEKLVKDSLDELENTIQGVSDLSPYHYEGTFIGGDALQNDFDNLIVAFEDLRGYEYAFKETKLQGSYFVCSADSAFYFNPYYHWSPAEGTSKTSAITYTWSAPYDLNGIEEINMKPGDIISILDFSYDANSNTISTLIKVEKNLEEAFVVKNETIVGKTKPKITYDEKGLVIAGEDLTPDDIPTLPVAKIEGLSTTIPTVTNDLTDDLKENYDDAYTHSQTNHAPSNAEQNVQSDWNQTVDTEDDFIKNKPTIPTKTSDLTNDSGFATETYVNNKVSAVYKPQGSVLFSSLVVGLLVAANSGFVYNITDAFTTNENFVEGAGKSHSAGTNVVIIEHSGNYKFDVLGGTVDLTPYELLSNKVIAWSETTNDTRYPSEKLVKDSLDELENTIQGVSDLSPYHYEGTFIGGDALQNDFDNLIVAFEDLRGYEYAFKETKLQGSYFVCSADSAFYFNPYYHWSPAEGTSKTSAITYTWSAPYDLNGIEEINMKPGDIISILDFSYDANSNTISTLIKVEKNLEENFVLKNDTITGATKTKITYDAKGLVTAAADLIADDIPTHQHTKSEITDFPTIPTVPTISTDIETDATSDIKTTSPKAVKTYVDNAISTAIGDIDAILNSILGV